MISFVGPFSAVEEALARRNTSQSHPLVAHSSEKIPKKTLIFIGIACGALVLLIIVISALLCKYHHRPKYRYADVKRVIIMRSVSFTSRI